ncbi:copper resistance D domain-containing protein [Paramagnetospirillum caucaseum]|uniref:Copper resistance D domain-containing protein n=1 Tax=Paramagnetospirillum caucaseum TaxID=1244869 RepID=M2ZB75_9PROT|nr:CopD family protein [Paramagnetospirillum caucaseum]EME71665.1 copper resistance D domain-containing protein [Paramagnetospirillum caucaseum]
MLTTLPPDILAFFAVILRGLQLTAQSVILGGVLFLFGFTRPLAPKLGGRVLAMERTGLTWTARGGLALALVAGLSIFANLSQLVAGLKIEPGDAMGADFVQWNLIMATAAMALAVTARMQANPAQVPSMALLAAVVLGASVMSSHAFARVDEREYYILADALHQAGASLWIGGIPFMLLALTHVKESRDRLLVGMRFSHLFTGAVGLLLLGAAMLAWGYISTPGALIGTAYGIMTGAKIILLSVLLLLAAMNRKSTRSEAADKGQFRLRRFAEVEIGIGVTVLMIAASMASQPPAADQTQHQATIMEIVERMAPVRAPRLVSPPSETLSIGIEKTAASETADRMWSEFNHNWAGIFVLAMGLGAMAHRMGVGPARHWPLLFLVIGTAIIIRSDPESWPIGPHGFFETLADPEVFQHRVVGLLLFPFGLFEWAVRTGRLKSERAALIFPILCAVGAGLLLVHNHTLTDVKERFLIEFSHIPMGLFGVMAGWLRWLEIRGDGRARRVAGLLWPVCFSMVGVLLMFYRELP